MKVTIIFVLISVCLVNAQQVQDFTLTNVADGKKTTLSSYKNCTGLVILFTSNECAYDNYYRGRIKELVEVYKGQIQFLLVNSFTEPLESETSMKATYNKWNIPVPYLSDKDQVAMQCMSAKKSPEAFLLKNSSGNFTLIYQGAIDDNPQVASDVNQQYLKDNISKLLSNQKIEMASTRAVGCTIRKK